MIKYIANLSVFSKELTAEDIEDILSIKADKKKKMGDKRIEYEKCILRNEENIWVLTSKIDPSLPLSEQIESLFKRIRPKIKNFSLIEKKCEVVFDCIVEGDLDDGNPELNFPTRLIKDFSLINASLDIDLYLV